MDNLERRTRLLTDRKISLVLDVGANSGQFAQSMRTEYDYAGRIISFEPLKDAFAALEETSANDPLWRCLNLALGDTNAVGRINVSANSYSSSLLDAVDHAIELEPSIGYVADQEITIRRLDGLFDELTLPDDRIYLKIDTQGYETQVLNGALGVLDRFELIQLETSLIPVYHGEPLIGDVIKFLDYLSFRIVSIEPGWYDQKSGELLQTDLIFARK